MTDNAMSNTTMIKVMSNEIPSFPGLPLHTRCFDHIIHLTAKSLLRLFDVASERESEAAQNATEASLRELAAGLDLEEGKMVTAGLDTVDDEGGDAESEDDDEIEGEFDEVKMLSDEERMALDESVLPVKLVLVKVCSHSNPSNDLSLTY